MRLGRVAGVIKGSETGAATFCHSLAHRFYWADTSSDAILARLIQTVPGRGSLNPGRAVGASSGDYENENTSEHG